VGQAKLDRLLEATGGDITDIKAEDALEALARAGVMRPERHE
jgi:hypothetical protein